MSESTGPILAAAGIVILNDVLTQHADPASDGRVVVGALIAAVGLSVLERVLPGAAVMLSWLVVVGVSVVRITPNVPSPLESLLAWYQGNGSTK